MVITSRPFAIGEALEKGIAERSDLENRKRDELQKNCELVRLERRILRMIAAAATFMLARDNLRNLCFLVEITNAWTCFIGHISAA